MLEVRLRGYRATYTTADGWRCNDQLTEKYLRERCSPKTGGEEAALAAVETEWGDGCELVADHGDAPAATAAPTERAPGAESDVAPDETES